MGHLFPLSPFWDGKQFPVPGTATARAEPKFYAGRPWRDRGAVCAKRGLDQVHGLGEDLVLGGNHAGVSLVAALGFDEAHELLGCIHVRVLK